MVVCRLVLWIGHVQASQIFSDISFQSVYYSFLAQLKNSGCFSVDLFIVAYTFDLLHVSIIAMLSLFHTQSLILPLLFSEGSSNARGGASSRPLGSDDLRLIEEDLSKQLSVDTVDRDMELNTEPYVSSLENGGEVMPIVPFHLSIYLFIYYATSSSYACLVLVLLTSEMFYSMGPGCMTSSVMSTRSGSELSDSDMESSIHSQSSLAPTHPLSPQVSA